MQPEIIPHLFRTEFRKITAVLCKRFGMENVNIAEDLASETFLSALETWPYKGLPENPTAWLYTVAKNKAKNMLARNEVFYNKITPFVQAETPEGQESDIDLSPENIADSQLQMLFAICHPSIPPEAQIGLALRILCGFGIDEISTAFLSNKETINKRLYRAKEKLRTEKVAIAFPPESEIAGRLQPVLTTLYLLFNEGYYSESRDEVLRNDLCLEAMRLAQMLIAYPPTNLPNVNALLALMCFHASRFESRRGDNGQMVLYQDQDEALWDRELIAKGIGLLNTAATGDKLSKYHIEASIAYWHTIKEDTPEKWENILQLFNHLLVLEYSPVAALNRTYALAKVRGNDVAIIEAEKLQLTNNQYYFTLLGELYKNIDPQKALENLQQALARAKTQADKQVIQAGINNLTGLKN
jgi:RNA polymerase sigma factor (sigma-70 family)